MSVKSAVWVYAHLRRCNARGLFATLARRGADEAGSIYVRIDRLDGSGLLLGPAPGPAYDHRGERRWVKLIADSPVSARSIDDYLRRLESIDPDIWILEIEDRHGTAMLGPMDNRPDKLA
jgi:hypothetical protein